MSADPFEHYLCAYDSVTCGEPCERCRQLIESGENRGALPFHAIPRAAAGSLDCTVCRGERPGDGRTERYCDTCRGRALRGLRRARDPWNDAPAPVSTTVGKPYPGMFVR